MKKRISQILSFGFLALVVVAVLVCAIVKLDYMPQFKLPEYPEVVQITDSEAGARTQSLTGDEYTTFTAKFNDSFKLSILYSLFSGKLGKKIGTPKKVTKVTKASGYKVEFMFADEQVLKDNGEEVKVAKNSNETVKFTRVLFYVEADKGLNDETTMYFYTDTPTYYSITTMANFDDLYNFIKTMSMFED